MLVGIVETPFSIHRDLLTSKSTFFNAALAGSWKEAATGRIRLTDEDPELFSVYVLWIYNQDWKSTGAGKAISFDACCRLYVLADKLGSEVLQDVAIDKLCEYAMGNGAEIHVAAISFVYGATLPGSVLRRLLADLLAWELDVTKFKALIDAAPECLYDALKVCTDLLTVNSKVAPPYRDESACKNYHVHQDGKPCSFPSKRKTGQDKPA